jgi:hypothetical protein
VLVQSRKAQGVEKSEGRKIRCSKRSPARASRAACLWLVVLVSSGVVAELQSTVSLGRAIYQHGETQSGNAYLHGGESEKSTSFQTSVPSSLVPCANCHGDRGEGKVEGGVIAPNITWPQLTLSESRTRDKAYTLATFSRALTQGINADGGRLKTTMPRYELGMSEVQALSAYLQSIQSQPESGIDDGTIWVSLILPNNSELAYAIREVTELYISELNQIGGIFQRSIRIAEPLETLNHENFVELDLSFSSSTVRANRQPVKSATAASLSVFAGNKGLDKPDSKRTSYALYPHPGGYARLKRSIAEREGWQVDLIDSGNLVPVLQQLGVLSKEQRANRVLIPDAELSLDKLLQALIDQQLDMRLLIDSVALADSGPMKIQSYQGQIFLMLPPGLESVGPSGRQRFTQLMAQVNGQGFLTQRVWALSLLSLFESVLRQSGRDLSGKRFNQILQQQVDFDSGFGPKLSFSSSSRIGSNSVFLQLLN